MTPLDSTRLSESIRKLRQNGYPKHEVEALVTDVERVLGLPLPDADHQDQFTGEHDQIFGQDSIFRQIVSDAAVAIGVFAQQKVLFANTKLMDMFGYSSRKHGDMKYSDFFCDRASNRTKAILQQREELIEKALVELDPFVGEFTLEDGRRLFLEVHSKPIDTAAGRWRVCFMLDVTERLQTRIELDQKMHRLEGIISGTDAGTWEWDLIEHNGIYNAKWASMIGYEVAELKELGGDLWSSVVHPEDAEMVTRKTIDLVTGKTDILQFEARLRHKDGHWVWVHSRGRITDWTEDGRPHILSGANIDISEKTLAEEKLLQTKIDLEHSLAALKVASQAKEDFLSTMSHEIRTPLNAVIGLSNLLLRKQPRPDQLEIVKTLKTSSDNLLHLVNDILDYNKIQAGKLQLESVHFKFRDLLEHLYATFKLDAHDRGIVLEVKADSEIPDVLEGDVTRLNQILINLLSNALKFTRKGKVSLSATLIKTFEGECTIRFVITDTGIGIHPSRLANIFEPFHQSDASISRQFGGTGLGLSIIKALVKMFEGTIDVTSLPGVGSSFVVELKLRETSSQQFDLIGGKWELPFNSGSLEVLYVEDVESNRFLVKHIMEEFDLRCTIAANSDEALEACLKRRFNIILMDIQMPDLDGYQIAERIRTQPGGRNTDTPVVAFTAEPITDTLRARLRAHQMIDVISKPFDIEMFMEKISFLAGGIERDREYSFDFYERNGINENIRSIVADEIDAFSEALLMAYDATDIDRIRSEIHKLQPIIKNLKMFSVLPLLEQIRSSSIVDNELLSVINAVRSKIMLVVADLRKPVETQPVRRFTT